MEPLFNPTQVQEQVQARYQRHPALGLAWEPLHYVGSSNRTYQGVEFYVDRFFAQAQPSAPDIRDFRAFLRAFMAPPEASAGTPSGAPPRLLFIWPDVAVMEAVVTDLEFQYKQFDTYGDVLVYTATCALEAVALRPVTSESLRQEL
jgi:hypothetical protein